jgi:hypothetical protein
MVNVLRFKGKNDLSGLVDRPENSSGSPGSDLPEESADMAAAGK